MATHRTLLQLDSLEERRVPATLNLTTAGTQGVLNSAHFSQLNPGALGTDPTNTFLRLQESSFFGSLFTPEEGYNTSARPLQYDATGNLSTTRSLLLKDIPLVTHNGGQYYELLLTVNQPQFTPNIDLQELRLFLSGVGTLSGYNTNTDRLAGLAASFDLDAGGNNTVRMNDNLNRTSSADVRVLIPASVFGNSDPDTTYVYLYSKFSAFVGTTFLSGAESWAVRELPPPPPPSTVGSLAGRVFDDMDGDGQYDEGEGIGGLTITLSGFNQFDENLFPDGDLTVMTNSDGSYDFGDLVEGTYFIMITPQGSNDSFSAVVGTTTDETTAPGSGGTDNFSGIVLSAGEEGTNYNFLLNDVE